MPIPKTHLPGLSSPISQLIIGCDNKDSIEDAAPVWDHWMDVGGNAFDTAFVYGGGRHEAILGQWIKTRGTAKDIVVISKGAHTPHCTPDAITSQLTQSLERLQLDKTTIYIMHRDNEDVPVGEFVDTLNREISSGRLTLYGGSNWSTQRFAAACTYARDNNLQAPSILNNNLSLAVMERAVWPGCITSNTQEALHYLRDTNTVHLSWSSQARGYFLPEELRNRLPEDTRPEACFGSEANAERRRRAETLAAKRGVSPHNIATAWVLNQTFPSLALVGPRTVEEIDTTLPGVNIGLSADEVKWLNLEV